MSSSACFREILKDKKMTDGKYELSLAEFVRPFAASNEEVTVSGKGTSMLPTITEECSLIMAPLPERGARAGDIVLYERANGQSVIHRVWRVTDRGYDMLGDNQLLVERNVPEAAAIAYVKTILYPDGSQKSGYTRIQAVRVRQMYRLMRRFAGKVFRKLFRR